MKKILSLVLTAAMLMSAVVMTAGASDVAIGEGVYAPNMPSYSEESWTVTLDENQVDSQGVYYSLDSENMTAIVGKNTYSDSASADAGLTTDSIVIPVTVIFGGVEYSVTTIGRNAFDGTDIREVIFDGFYVGEFAFAGCTKLEYVDIWGDEISGFAFWGCTALTEAYVHVNSLGGGAFWNCFNLQNVTFGGSTIMEKAFEGCDNLDYIVLLDNAAPAVAAGALGTIEKAYVMGGTTGFEEFPIPVEVMAIPIVDIEDVYGKPGETVEVSVMVPAGIYDGNFEIGLSLAEGLTVAGVISGNNNCCVADSAAYDAGKLTGTADYAYAGVLAALKITLPADAAGTYAITAEAEKYICIAGSITVCDHANTKIVTVKAASCDEAGVENTVCTACGEILSSADVESKGHTYKDFVIAPTCTEAGYTRHICECCADAYSDGETEALGHSWNEGEVIVQVSTTKDGLVRYTCLTCGTTEDVKVPKIKYGDANCDGNINTSDAAISLQFIAGWDLTGREFSELNADVNADDKVLLSDVSLLMKHIAGWEGVVFGPQK